MTDASSKELQLPSPAQGQLPGDATMIDVIIYVAGLASRQEAIDSHLDKLRVITAKQGAGEPLTTQEVQTLQALYERLETYMVEAEPLRSFTRQSLRQQLYDHFQSKRRQWALRKKLAVIWAGALAGVIIPFVLADSNADENTTISIAAAYAFATIFAGAAWLFWAAFQNFKPALRQRFGWVVGGIGLLSVSLLQIPLLIFLNLESSLWLDYGGVTAQIALSALLIYMGLRRFYQLAGARRTMLMSWPVLGGLAAVAITVVILLPHITPPVPEAVFDLSLALFMAMLVVAVFAATLALVIGRALASVYKRPMRWLAVALGMLVVLALQYTVLQLALPDTNWYEASGLAELPFILAAFFMLKAGVTFYKASMY